MARALLCHFGLALSVKFPGDGKFSIKRLCLTQPSIAEMLSNCSRSEVIESYRECVDPFEEPECEACDLFIDETVCIGKGCPQSCVAKAPNAFSFVSSTGTARATSQGFSGDYHVQLAVGQCPRSCIHLCYTFSESYTRGIVGQYLGGPL